MLLTKHIVEDFLTDFSATHAHIQPLLKALDAVLAIAHSAPGDGGATAAAEAASGGGGQVDDPLPKLRNTCMFTGPGPHFPSYDVSSASLASAKPGDRCESGACALQALCVVRGSHD